MVMTMVMDTVMTMVMDTMIMTITAIRALRTVFNQIPTFRVSQSRFLNVS